MVRFHRHHRPRTAFGLLALFAGAAAAAAPSDWLTPETQEQLANLPPEDRAIGIVSDNAEQAADSARRLSAACSGGWEMT